jgi:predicted Zn-dependent peptidase
MALGRPRKAAQSVDEALAQHYAGLSPKRPRNEFEREAMRRQKGRPTNPSSPTQIAAQYAAYLVKSDGLPLREAARVAALSYKLKPDSIRKPARALLRGPQVKIIGSVATWAGRSTTEKTVPLLVSVTDAN